jgi:DNA-binding response OmpR family regulator
MNRILVVEDEPDIAGLLEKGLRANGYETTLADDGASAGIHLKSSSFDLVILDLGLPETDGITVLQELRRKDHRTPVIILTGRDRGAVSGFEAGADDYVTKPFRFDELLARIRARLREERAGEETVLAVGEAKLDLLARRLTVGGTYVELTAREFALAEVFFRNVGRVLSREQLLDQVWGYDYDPGSNVVDVYVSYLRHKLGRARITTVRGMGYRLEPDGQRASALS